MSRRNFMKILGLGAVFSLSNGLKACAPTLSTDENPHPENSPSVKPIVIATWYHGLAANEAAWAVLEKGGKAIDAVEKGVMVTESDIKNTTVGIGGTPDRDGHVTLDACIMDEEGRCGAVAFLEHIEHPIQVARLVMEKTPHVMLVGDGALQFALEQGMKKTKLLTKEAEEKWKEWKKTSKYETPINIENHDTISMLAIDQNGDISGACTTSGMAYKMHGRVGDSPIIGAGLFVDNEVGGAAATGVGELVMRTLGSFLVVEFMRQGMSPEAACKAAVDRIVSKHESVDDMQVGFIALNKKGEFGGYSIHKGFDYAVTYQDFHEMEKAKYLMQ
jgi:N4-(beta-N-acetylglucosaminyl)-L-asparaginase